MRSNTSLTKLFMILIALLEDAGVRMHLLHDFVDVDAIALLATPVPLFMSADRSLGVSGLLLTLPLTFGAMFRQTCV